MYYTFFKKKQHYFCKIEKSEGIKKIFEKQ